MLFQGSSAEISHYLGPENLVVQNILWNNHWLGVLWMASRLRLLQASSICRARSDLAVLLSWPVHSVFSCPFICIRDHDLFATLSLHRRGFWISKAVFHSPFLFLLVACFCEDVKDIVLRCVSLSLVTFFLCLMRVIDNGVKAVLIWVCSFRSLVQAQSPWLIGHFPICLLPVYGTCLLLYFTVKLSPCQWIVIPIFDDAAITIQRAEKVARLPPTKLAFP